jgi:hypothetical protein
VISTTKLFDSKSNKGYHEAADRDARRSRGVSDLTTSGATMPPSTPSSVGVEPAPTNANKWAELNKSRKETAWRKFLFPLFYAPVLPLVSIALRNHPHLRNRAYAGGIVVGLAHAGWVMSGDSSV